MTSVASAAMISEESDEGESGQDEFGEGIECESDNKFDTEEEDDADEEGAEDKGAEPAVPEGVEKEQEDSEEEDSEEEDSEEEDSEEEDSEEKETVVEEVVEGANEEEREEEDREEAEPEDKEEEETSGNEGDDNKGDKCLIEAPRVAKAILGGASMNALNNSLAESVDDDKGEFATKAGSKCQEEAVGDAIKAAVRYCSIVGFGGVASTAGGCSFPSGFAGLPRSDMFAGAWFVVFGKYEKFRLVFRIEKRE